LEEYKPDPVHGIAQGRKLERFARSGGGEGDFSTLSSLKRVKGEKRIAPNYTGGRFDEERGTQNRKRAASTTGHGMGKKSLQILVGKSKRTGKGGKGSPFNTKKWNLICHGNGLSAAPTKESKDESFQFNNEKRKKIVKEKRERPAACSWTP